MEIIKTSDPNIPAKYLADKIIAQLESGKKVLWFITGGSSITVQLSAGEMIAKHSHQNLTIALTDERYGEVGHKDSNWQKTIDGGFNLPQAKLIPVLTGETRDKTVELLNDSLKEELTNADYKIGLFGVGSDGHTAGILPQSVAVTYEEIVCGYTTENFERITTTPKLIKNLDEAVVFIQGEAKWGVVKDLNEKNIDLETQPAQILKSIPLLTIFTDYQK
jgi:6-phosphogluconolactonase/glucosamine-6-phosphate isomerase/deaminase